MISEAETTSTICPHYSTSNPTHIDSAKFVAARLPHFSKDIDVEQEINLIDACNALPELFVLGSPSAESEIFDEAGETSDMVDVAALICLWEDAAIEDFQNQDKGDDWIMLLPQD